MPTKNLSDLPSPPPPMRVREDIDPFRKKAMAKKAAAKKRKRRRLV